MGASAGAGGPRPASSGGPLGSRPAPWAGSDERRYWSEVADSVATAEPDPLWRRYSDRVNRALLRAWLPGADARSLLKTDLFDEAWTDGFLWDRDEPAVRTDGVAIGIDTSPVVAARALLHHPGAPAASADVRCLPFRDATFDAVVSPSTLDHFVERAEIVEAVRELHRIVRPGGHVLITLDNPLHPLVALRSVGLGLWQGLGLISYRLGVTLRPAELAEVIESVGLEVVRAGAVQHFPRVALIALDRVLGRGTRLRGRLLRWAVAQERLDRLPTRYRTGQFIAALARRPG